MRFSDIPGLRTAKEKLLRTIQTGKIAHAQMFSGPEGSANLAMALAYASLLNCTKPHDGDSCGECASCKKADKLIHPDLHFVFPVSSTKNITGKDVVSDAFIADWRQFIIHNPYGGPMEWSLAFGGENKQLNISREESRNILRKLSLMPYEGEYKIMIIWLAEYLHASAANALLKLLEEPPDKTVFLLVTYDSEQIISTILSRVQLLKIRPFTNDEVVGYLMQKHGLGIDEAYKTASIVSGDINHALKMVTEEDDGSSASFQEWMRICFTNNYQKMVEWADNFSSATKINQKGLFQYGLSIIRDALLSQNSLKDLVNTTDSDKKFADNFAKVLGLDQLEILYKLLNTAYYHLERNANPKITFLNTSLQISAAFKKQK
jgi:DNA polymerase-3 subunit delta'